MSKIEEQWAEEEAEPIICHCLCEAVHPRLWVCDYAAPRALLSLDTAGTRMEAEGRKEIVMCQPCGEAAMERHPRARDLVVFEVREKSAS
jgi:hypothetical protein